MTDDSKATGIVSYQGPKANRVLDALSLLKRKAELRAALVGLQEKIDLALPHLDQAQTQELLSRMAAEVGDAAGPDLVRVRQEAAQAAEGIRPCDVRLNRPAAQALRQEVVHRLSAGLYCPPTEILVAEAVRNQFERR
jgi:hypothetical protein